MTNLVLQAAAFAGRAHVGQVRRYGGEPYIYHPGRVAAIVTVRWAREDLIIAAWLHDVVEDTPITLEDIRREFGWGIENLVRGLTNTSKTSGANRAARKAMDRERLAHEIEDIQRIKLADRYDNLRDMGAAPPDFRRLYADESRKLVQVIAQADEGLAGDVLVLCDRLEEPTP